MILVTGGLGFLGSHIALNLMSKGHEVVIVDNLSHSSMETLERLEYITKMYIPFIRLDVRNTPALQKIFEQYTIDYVVNAAGFKSLHEAQLRPLDYYNNNMGITMSLLRAMQRASVRRLVNLSSVMVYGEHGLAWTEDSILTQQQDQPYIFAQQMNEQILKDIYKVDNYWQILNLRLSNVLGAHQSHHLGEWTPPLPNSVLPYLLQVVAGQRDIFEIHHQDLATEDGSSVRNYIHVMDVVDAVYQLMMWSNTQDHLFEHFNVTHDTSLSLKQLIKVVEQISLAKVTLENHHSPAAEIAAIGASNQKLKDKINWSPTQSVDDMVKDQWHYYQASLKKVRTAL